MTLQEIGGGKSKFLPQPTRPQGESNLLNKTLWGERGAYYPKLLITFKPIVFVWVGKVLVIHSTPF
jgi:hypothetical protein